MIKLTIPVTPEMSTLWDEVKPSLVGCHLPDDAPEEIKKNLERFDQLWDEQEALVGSLM